MRNQLPSDIKTKLYSTGNRVSSKCLPNNFEYIARNESIVLVFT